MIFNLKLNLKLETMVFLAYRVGPFNAIVLKTVLTMISEYEHRKFSKIINKFRKLRDEELRKQGCADQDTLITVNYVELGQLIDFVDQAFMQDHKQMWKIYSEIEKLNTSWD